MLTLLPVTPVLQLYCVTVLLSGQEKLYNKWLQHILLFYF